MGVSASREAKGEGLGVGRVSTCDKYSRYLLANAKCSYIRYE